MATGLYPFDALYNSEKQGETLRSDAGFTFVDFLPGVIQHGGFFKGATFENFRTLVDRANEFLRSNRKWKIVTCESVEFKSRCDKVNPLKMTYIEYEDSFTSFVRGLRLWLTERKDEKEREQQIGYINLIPQQLEKEGIFKTPKFESLNTVIERFNSMQRNNPLPGRIITIESQEMKFSKMKNFDPDRSNWTESGDMMESFVFIIRIFYEAMDGISEEIGVTDIVPGTVSKGGVFALPQFLPFSNVMHHASTWVAEHQDLRFCNAQTLEIKVSRGKEVNTQRMDYTESGSMTTYYVRILRLAYTKPFSNPYSISEKPSPITELTCRTFQPVLLSAGVFISEYENLIATRERISAWVKATGARVVNAETTAYRIRSGGERRQGTESTFTYNSTEMNEDFMFVIRLYLDGVFQEPPPEMLPAIPIIAQPSCNVS